MVEERERTGRVRGVARMIRGDGARIEVEVSARIFHEANGETRACTIIRDVTDRVVMERELHQSRERLSEAERVAQIGSWEWDIPCDRVSWSDGLFHIYGLTRDDFDPTVVGGEKRVYPDDRESVRETLRQAVAERSSFTLEYRAVRADGRVRTLRNRGEVVVDEAGEPIRVVGWPKTSPMPSSPRKHFRPRPPTSNAERSNFRNWHSAPQPSQSRHRSRHSPPVSSRSSAW